jgi:predicted amidohydrolase
MKAGFIQFAPELCNPEKTMNKLSFFLDEVSATDLIVLPELCNSGYNFKDRRQAFDCAEEIFESRFIEFLSEYCKKHQYYIASGFNERENDLLYNSAILVGPNGLIGKYRKIHLFLNEKDIFNPGNAGFPIFDTPIGKIGLLVCFDWIFPETWRILALKGADVICHCSNLVLPVFAQKSVPIHALVNHIYIITANRTGKEGDLVFTGMSTIAGPKGDVVYQADSKKDEAKFFDFDLSAARNKKMTPRNDLFADRRPELYRELIELETSR